MSKVFAATMSEHKGGELEDAVEGRTFSRAVVQDMFSVLDVISSWLVGVCYHCLRVAVAIADEEVLAASSKVSDEVCPVCEAVSASCIVWCERALQHAGMGGVLMTYNACAGRPIRRNCGRHRGHHDGPNVPRPTGGVLPRELWWVVAFCAASCRVWVVTAWCSDCRSVRGL